MMYLILSGKPRKAALLVPDKLKFKQLLELAQMISTITGSVYKPVKQGQKLIAWIKQNTAYTLSYYYALYEWAVDNIKMKSKTQQDLKQICVSLAIYNKQHDVNIKTAIFRYSKAYTGSEYATDTELPIDIAIEEYKKYLTWKGYEL